MEHHKDHKILILQALEAQSDLF